MIIDYQTCKRSQDEFRRLRARLREVTQIIVSELGAQGPMNAEEAARAYLRAAANAPHPIERGVPSLSPAGRGLLLLHADRIERGEHRRNGDK